MTGILRDQDFVDAVQPNPECDRNDDEYPVVGSNKQGINNR